MFTGLVEKIGKVDEVVIASPGRRLRIDCDYPDEDVKLGDSICVNGCCLTVVAIKGPMLDFEAGEETLSRTNLGELSPGTEVNIERALRQDDRMGGHYVTGHIDSLGTLIEQEQTPPWAKFWFQVPLPQIRQIASKGSVAIDGISLTVVDVIEDRFSVALIPHTLTVTTLGRRKSGDRVNIETDLLAKYVQRQLETQNA